MLTSFRIIFYNIYIYIYIYIKNQNLEKIKLESKLNFNGSSIVRYVSNLIFNICAKWIIEGKNRKVQKEKPN